MPEQDRKAKDVQTRRARAAEAQGRDDPQLHRPQQEVSILDDLVGSHETSPGRAQTTGALQSRLALVIVMLYRE